MNRPTKTPRRRVPLLLAAAAALLVMIPVSGVLGGDHGEFLLARLAGTWAMTLSAADKTTLEEAREALKKDPDDAAARSTVEGLAALEGAMQLKIDGARITFIAGERSEEEEVAVLGYAGDILMVRPADSPEEETLYVRITPAGQMVWAGEGDADTIWFTRVGDAPDVEGGGGGFLGMQRRAARSEAPSNADGIRTAEKAYHAEWDTFTAVSPCPPPEVKIGPDPQHWRPEWPCVQQFENLGWIPDGKARCRYAVQTSGVYPQDDFLIRAECDVDGDGVLTVYEATRAQRATMKTADDVY